MQPPEPDRVVIINDRSTHVGGASKLACELAGALHRGGTPVTFFAGDAPHDAPPVPDTRFLGQLPLTSAGAAVALTRGFYNRAAAKALSRLIAEQDTPRTIYHVHGWSKIFSPSIFGALRSVRARTVLHAHDFFLACPNGGFVNYQKLQGCDLTPLSARCLASRCDKRNHAHKLWRAGRHQLRRSLFPLGVGGARLLLIHEGMAPYLARANIPAAMMQTLRNPALPFLDAPGAPWAAKNFFFIGRVEAEKGAALAAAAAQLAHLPLHVIGTGAEAAELGRAYPQVVFHGWKQRDEIAALMGDCRALVVSSPVPEPYGLVIAEALGSGIPVILPDNALLAPEITAAHCGIAYRAGDRAALIAAMTRIAADDALVKQLSSNAQVAAKTVSNTAQTWVSALREIYGTMLSAPAAQGGLRRLEGARI
ncbi:MAG: glycosyltransferase family 4 protein [Sulfitobacter sp.]